MTGRRRVLVAAGLGGLLAGLGVWAAYRDEPAPTVRVPELSPAGSGGAGGVSAELRVLPWRCRPGHGHRSASHPRDLSAGPSRGLAFELAVRRGVRAHHWRFGDMPPQPTITPDAIHMITRYVRELQQANGID